MTALSEILTGAVPSSDRIVFPGVNNWLIFSPWFYSVLIFSYENFKFKGLILYWYTWFLINFFICICT
jgi:hypothetical protein